MITNLWHFINRIIFHIFWQFQIILIQDTIAVQLHLSCFNLVFLFNCLFGLNLVIIKGKSKL